MDKSDSAPRPTRRSVLESGVAAAAVLGFAGRVQAAPAPAAPTPPALAAAPATPRMPVTLSVNGQARPLEIDPRTTLLDALRERIGLTGSKKGCDHGQCGACTVLVNGRRINSCLTLAVMHEGDEIKTIEGLADGDHLHPLQAAFVKHDGFQCGYCTPGQICSAAGMLAEAKAGWPSTVTQDLTATTDLTDAEIRERMSGNICRCAAYPNIVAAIRDAGGAATRL
ncbi:2Fe-2S iron-sulfur cluster binding domain-containing protein [Methylobacterium terricola]|uniref:2Fe-2S iron-sulfur cluster binding domain-containing protein n=1 Tax=Methylobacterium terricola TaxID=2583531 RepID=A0A5C4LD82_9HYPH|nr:2Fe-2S iron-sulfur cluster-binding protein [Methylobacterium terricola]TNC10525.1 2Fe-2S iron-sulfur cluster binding domain-containing protein [Methylobacterium terricola]